MATATAAPQQFKQPSRKGKKAWRKNVDITHVEDGLETVRDEVIKGGVIAEKTSSELFTLDIAGNESIQREYNKHHKPLKADEILAQRSAVPAVDTRKRSSSKVTDGILEPTHGGGDVLRNGVMQDGIEAVKEPKTLKRAPVSLSANGKNIPAVARPKPETSYNPQSTQYFEALIREGEKEVQAELKRRQEAAAEEEKSLRAEEEREAAEAYERRMNEGAEEEGEESVWEGIMSEPEGAGTESKRVQRKKTRAERNKIARRKEIERKTAAEEKINQRAHQVTQLQQIMSSLEARPGRIGSVVKTAKAERGGGHAHDGEDDAHASSSSSDFDDEIIVRKRAFGKAPIPQETLDLVLPSDLQDSLRALKPEGNLLRDRFRNVILQGKLESRRPVGQRRKAKTKTTEKWSYKDWKLS